MANTFNPSSAMNTMMMSNHIMGHFNKIVHSNNSVYETLTDTSFISQTSIMLIQILFVSIFSAFSTHITENFSFCKRYIKMYNGTKESYFADYKNGYVQIINNKTGNVVYSTKVK